jgi:hypothetical protein
MKSAKRHQTKILTKRNWRGISEQWTSKPSKRVMLRLLATSHRVTIPAHE